MLTEKRIRDAKPGLTPFILWDGQVRGLGVKVQPGGTRSYVLSYRTDGRKRMASIGRSSEMSLREARERAAAELVRIRDGEADPLERRRCAGTAPTVAEGVERFFSEYVPRRQANGRLSERTERNYRRQWERTVRASPSFGSRKIKDVTRQDIEEAVAPRGPVERNRTVAFLSRVFNLFEAWDLRPQYSNPCRHVEKAKEQPRERVLAPSEIQSLGAALDKIDTPFPVACVRFLLLTGWRTGEALALRWDQINFETGQITLPRTKTGRQLRTVAKMVLEDIASLPRISSNPYVFAGARSAAIAEKTLRSCFARACRHAGIEDAQLHDLRRTFATSAAASGINVFVVRDLLNHSTLAMANRYVRRVDNVLQNACDENAARMVALMAGNSTETISVWDGKADRNL